MKRRKCLFMGMFTLLFFTVGCSDNKDAVVPIAEPSGPGVLEVKLVGDPGSPTRAAGAPALADEKKISGYNVYVFNYNNDVLEKMATKVGEEPVLIDGLSTGFTKRLVVLANIPEGLKSSFDFSPGDPFSKLEEQTRAISLETQQQSTGLLMFGDKGNVPVYDTEDSPQNKATVSVKRLVGKISLGTITIDPAAGHDLTKFSLTGVSIQKAIPQTTVFGEPYDGASIMWGGISGSITTEAKGFLNNNFETPLTTEEVHSPAHYFYVLPNSLAGNNTVLTLIGTYDGKTMYYPIEINGKVNDGDDTDGTLVKSNVHYIVSVTLQELGNGTTDPDVPPVDVNLEVTIEIEDWETINQTEVW